MQQRVLVLILHNGIILSVWCIYVESAAVSKINNKARGSKNYQFGIPIAGSVSRLYYSNVHYSSILTIK